MKSAPLGRKRKQVAAAAAEVSASPSDGSVAETPAVSTDVVSLDKSASEKTDSAVEPAVGDTASVTPEAARVSYRERRSGQRRGSSAKPAGAAKNPSGATRKRGNLRGVGIALAALTAIGLVAAMAVASALFVIGTGKIDDRNDQRAEYSAFARQMVTNLTTLNPENIDASIKSFQDDTSGKAMEQVGQSVEQTVNMIKSQNVSTKGAVISEAVTASDANSATVIMVFSWEMNQPNVTEQQTVLQTFRWRLEITRINGELKLTNVEWVT